MLIAALQAPLIPVRFLITFTSLDNVVFCMSIYVALAMMQTNETKFNKPWWHCGLYLALPDL
ncbi:hypothetical protein E2320_012660 [Naja naja]|nr:hypothetical protein E2320_012660 [Naja naja]